MIDEVGALTVNGSGGEVNVGYFTDVSWRKISMSRGVDLILVPRRDIWVGVYGGRK